ncbi:MAG: helix-turn-helix domain-containing protein [Pseudomonadota bacterium]
MNEALAARLEGSVRLPVRPQAKKTYEKILTAAQEILAESGIEALNSNAVVERAGLTAPVFYHYFKNKHALLLVLASRLLDAQDEIYARLISDAQADPEGVRQTSMAILSETYELTANTVGAGALLTALRAIPEISQFRVEGNERAAWTTAEQLKAARPELSDQEAYQRTLLGVEIGYSAIELLLQRPGFASPDVLELTANAIVAVYFD